MLGELAYRSREPSWRSIDCEGIRKVGIVKSQLCSLTASTMKKSREERRCVRSLKLKSVKSKEKCCCGAGQEFVYKRAVNFFWRQKLLAASKDSRAVVDLPAHASRPTNHPVTSRQLQPGFRAVNHVSLQLRNYYPSAPAIPWKLAGQQTRIPRQCVAGPQRERRGYDVITVGCLSANEVIQGEAGRGSIIFIIIVRVILTALQIKL